MIKKMTRKTQTLKKVKSQKKSKLQLHRTKKVRKHNGVGGGPLDWLKKRAASTGPPTVPITPVKIPVKLPKIEFGSKVREKLVTHKRLEKGRSFFSTHPNVRKLRTIPI